MKPCFTLACGKYDRTEALRDGTIQVEGADINYLSLGPSEIFWRMLKYQEFDISEMSMSSYMISRDRGFPDLMAIPVFPSRFFRHGHIFVKESSPITKPEDLKGKRVGVPEYEMTAAVWVRGLLQHDYGVHPREIEWFVSREEKYDLNLEGVKVEKIPEGKGLEEMLEAGEIDALNQNRLPKALGKGVRRVIPNHKHVEADYFKRTGVFPIMHTVVIRGEVFARHPWLARSLYKAFEASKLLCQQEMYNPTALKTTLAWLIPEIEEERAILGADPWPYGLEANRKTLEAMVGYAFEQGLLKKRPALEELFAPAQWENEPAAGGRKI